MSDLDFDPYAGAAAEERERSADWQENVDHWRRERDDALTRDKGESAIVAYHLTHAERVRDAGYVDGDPKGGSAS